MRYSRRRQSTPPMPKTRLRLARIFSGRVAPASPESKCAVAPAHSRRKNAPSECHALCVSSASSSRISSSTSSTKESSSSSPPKSAPKSAPSLPHRFADLLWPSASRSPPTSSRLPQGGLLTTSTPPPPGREVTGPSFSRSTNPSPYLLFSRKFSPASASSFSKYSSSASRAASSAGWVRSPQSPCVKDIMPSTPAATAALRARLKAPPCASLPMSVGATLKAFLASAPIASACKSASSSNARS
mmetsp:Transcript_13229/g.56356  ORF Transcript_13229/g.56356 Transcript_13229/m.56356 type:complete len:244 (-) Transcript_13229:690-1421(-)